MRGRNFVVAIMPMSTENLSSDELETALDRAELALDRLETAVAARAAQVNELDELKVRHRKLKETVAGELRQLDLLLANLPQ